MIAFSQTFTYYTAAPESIDSGAAFWLLLIILNYVIDK
jgi:hypothetical protein